MNVRPPKDWATRSCRPAAIPSSSRSTASASAASSPRSSETSCSSHSARNVAITIALEPPSPTPLGTDVSHSTVGATGSGLWSRAKRLTVAATSSLSGLARGSDAALAVACAWNPSSVTAITAPPYPSDGFPASAARADAAPRPTRSGVIEQRGCASSQLGPEAIVRQGVLEKRGTIALERADVVAPLACRQRHRNDASSLPDDLAQGIGDLDLAAPTGGYLRERREHSWTEHVAAHDRHPARSAGRVGLLDHV